MGPWGHGALRPYHATIYGRGDIPLILRSTRPDRGAGEGYGWLDVPFNETRWRKLRPMLISDRLCYLLFMALHADVEPLAAFARNNQPATHY
jgi:hypothetical protein